MCIYCRNDLNCLDDLMYCLQDLNARFYRHILIDNLEKFKRILKASHSYGKVFKLGLKWKSKFAEIRRSLFIRIKEGSNDGYELR